MTSKEDTLQIVRVMEVEEEEGPPGAILINSDPPEGLSEVSGKAVSEFSR